MKVLHLINYTGGGGTESYIYSLAKQMHNNNCTFYIAYSIKGDSHKKFEDLGIKMIHINMDGPYDFKAAKKLAKICKDLDIDVVHTHFLRENYISILSKLFSNKAKMINTRHMMDISPTLVNLNNMFMTRFNHSIIAVSKAVEDLLKKELGNRKNIKLIYTGIDLNDFKNIDSNNLKSELNIPEDELVIISTARFSEEKGHRFLLESLSLMNELYDDIPKYKVLLVGDGALLDESINLSKKLNLFNDIIFTGYRSDVDRLLNISDLFVCMSCLEAFGISILEAMASKLPIITTDTGGTREIIQPDSEDGILLDYDDTEALAKAIYSLLKNSNLREKYSNNGYNLVKNKFSLKVTADKTYELYNK